MSMRRDLRRHKREVFEARLNVGWEDERGISRYTIGRCMDISESGMKVDLSEPVPARAYVNFRFDGIRFEGSGSVRHCIRVGVRHRIGIEFAGGLKWRFAPQAVA